MKNRALIALLVGCILMAGGRPIAHADGGGDGACDDTVAFQPGGPLLNIDSDKSILLNALLSSLIGVDVHLEVGDYGHLVGAEIEVRVLLEKLGLSEGCSWEEAFCREVSVHAILVALAAISIEEGHHEKGAALHALAALVVDLDAKVRLCDFIRVDHPDGIRAVAHLKVDIFGLLIACLSHHQHHHGRTPIFVEIDGGIFAAANLLGLVRLKVEILRPSVIVLGRVGTQFATAAARIWLEVAPRHGALEIDADVLGLADVNLELVSIPIAVEIGAGAGVITCIDATSGTVAVDAEAGLSAFIIGKLGAVAGVDVGVADGYEPCDVGHLSMRSPLGASASAVVAIKVAAGLEATVDGSLDFCGPYPQSERIEASGILSLLAGADVRVSIKDLEVDVLGLGLDLSASQVLELEALLTARLHALVLEIGAEVLTHVIEPVSVALGISVGALDVHVLSMGHGRVPDECTMPKDGDYEAPDCCVPATCSDLCEGHDWGIYPDHGADEYASYGAEWDESSATSDSGHAPPHGGLCSTSFHDAGVPSFLWGSALLLLGAAVRRRKVRSAPRA